MTNRGISLGLGAIRKSANLAVEIFAESDAKSLWSGHCLTVLGAEMLACPLGPSHSQTLPFSSIFLIDWLSGFSSPLSLCVSFSIPGSFCLLSVAPSPLPLSVYTNLLIPSISTPSSIDLHHCHFCPPSSYHTVGCLNDNG